MVGDGMWSQTDCQKTIVSAAKELEDAGATVVGVCVQVKVA